MIVGHTVWGTGTARGDQINVDTDGARVDVEGLKTMVRITGSETIDRLQINSLDGNDEYRRERRRPRWGRTGPHLPGGSRCRTCCRP